MKKQLSKRIGAILTMTAMLMTLLPMAIPVMATGETETVNLIENGDFSHADGYLTGWTSSGTAVTEYGIDKTETYGLTLPAVNLKGKNGAYLTQVVKDLTPQKSYKLSVNMVNYKNNPNGSITATITFGQWNEETETFTKLDSSTGLMEGPLLNGGSGETVTSYTSLRLSAGTSEKCNRAMYFNLPANADAVTVKLEGTTSGNQTATRYMLLDDVVLEECTDNIEMINNGEFFARSTGALDGWAVDTVSIMTRDYVIGVTDGTNAADTYLKISKSNAVSKDYSYLRQLLTLRHSKLYKLSFDFAQSGFEESKTPDLRMEIIKTNDISTAVNLELVHTGTTIVSEENDPDWKTYETYITLDKPNGEYAFDLVNVEFGLNYGETTEWPEGAAVYYDNISLTEVDADTQIAFAAGKNGEFTTTPADAKVASCIFVQGETPTIQKFIVAKYNSTTNALESATVINAGEGIKAGNAKRYDVELDELSGVYYRIFLFDGTTLKPVIDDPKRIG